MQTILAGSESGAFEKLTAALRQAAEGARSGQFGTVTDNLRRGVEAAAELGVYLSDGRWSLISRALDTARVMVTELRHAGFIHHREDIAGQFDVMLGRVGKLRHGRVIH
jgi:hypothetical protein